jgi:hypothetical protein
VSDIIKIVIWNECYTVIDTQSRIHYDYDKWNIYNDFNEWYTVRDSLSIKNNEWWTLVTDID